MEKTEERRVLADIRTETPDLCRVHLAGWLETGLIFAAGLLIFLLGLGNREFIQLECRTALFVREMFENGIHWFPTVYSRPYPDYPVTHPALIYAVSSLFGRLTIQTAVLPTALAAAISLALTYRIGLIASRSVALWAVLLELGTYGFFSTARSVSLDHLTTAVTAACFLAVCSWLLGGNSRQLGLVLLLCVVGFACRGPIGFLLPAGVAVTCCLVERRYRAFLLLSLVLLALLTICALGLTVAAEQAGGRAFVRDVWYMQAGARLSGSHAKGLYYYLIHGLTTYAISFPLAVAVLIGVRKPLFLSFIRRQPTGVSSERLLGLLAASFLVLFIGLHIPSAKMARYLLPLAPMTSLIAAYLMAETGSEHFRRARAGLVRALGLLPAIGLGAAGLLFAIWRYLPLDAKPSWWFLFVALSAAAAVRLKLVPRISRLETREYLLGLLGFAVLAVVQVSIVEPVKESLEQARPFVVKAEAIRGDTQPLVFFGIGPDQEDVRYVSNAARPMMPLFVGAANDLLHLPDGALVIARDSDFAGLPGRVRKRTSVQFGGRLGHSRCVVFRLARLPWGRK